MLRLKIMLVNSRELKQAGFVTGDKGYLAMRCPVEKTVLIDGFLLNVYDTGKAIEALQSRIDKYRMSLRRSDTTEKKMVDILKLFKKTVKKLEKQNERNLYTREKISC